MSSWFRKLVPTVALAMASTGTAVSAQARIIGTVRDTTGAPIAGVEITATGTTRTATTDQNGAFRIDGLPIGATTVTTRRLGYAPQSTVLRLAGGDNTMPDIILTVLPRELDTVSTREQQLWRERPLLREFEENRRLGMGQFITRAEFEKNKGGFMSPMLDRMRGLVVVRGDRTHTWLANKYVPNPGICTELEEKSGREIISPRGADCNYCFPEVYLDYSRISSRGSAPNIGQFNPDMLEAMEVYLGAAETPMRYASGATGCGVVVLHTRAPQLRQRALAGTQPGVARARFSAHVSAAAAMTGANCTDCGIGSAFDGAVGYTFRERWVLGARYAKYSSSANGPQSLSLRTAMVEWYPHPEPGRFKWFTNAGVGKMSVDLISQPTRELIDTYRGTGLTTMTVGTGTDVALLRRLVLTPFWSYSRSFSGTATREHCILQIPASGPVSSACFLVQSSPHFTFTQLGARAGWR